MKVKDVMTVDSLKSCSLETKVHNVAKTMKDANLGALPVLDSANKVVGIVTDRDIALSLASKNETSNLTIKDIVSGSKVHTIKADDTLSTALEEMRKNKVGRLPVIDKDGKLSGIVSVNKIISQTLVNNEEMGKINSKDENLARTLKAITDRNSSATTKTKKEEEVSF